MTSVTRAIAGRRSRAASSVPAAPPARPVTEVVATLAGAVGLSGSLLFYFGWARAASTFGYFGVDASAVDLSFRDYVLRSVGSAYWPATVGAAAALLALGGHRLLLDRASARARRIVGITLAGIGGLAALAGIAAVLHAIVFHTDWPVVPVLLLTGTALLRYGPALANKVPMLRADRPAQSGLVAGLLVLLVFWTLSSYAAYRGQRVAEEIATHLSARPAIVVFSGDELLLHGNGVTAVPTGRTGVRYGWCYTGLRLLVRSGDRYLLLPEQWQRGRDPVIVLPALDRIRVEYVRSHTRPACG